MCISLQGGTGERGFSGTPGSPVRLILAFNLIGHDMISTICL